MAADKDPAIDGMLQEFYEVAIRRAKLGGPPTSPALDSRFSDLGRLLDERLQRAPELPPPPPVEIDVTEIPDEDLIDCLLHSENDRNNSIEMGTDRDVEKAEDDIHRFCVELLRRIRISRPAKPSSDSIKAAVLEGICSALPHYGTYADVTEWMRTFDTLTNSVMKNLNDVFERYEKR